MAPAPSIGGEHRAISRRIADGHAWDEHVDRRTEYWEFADRTEFTEHINDVISTGEPKLLPDGKSVYWKNGTVVWVDPHNADGGTAFRPRRGHQYFRELHQ